MNWSAQVRHVATKDVRQARWALLVYVAMLSVAAAAVVTGRAFGPYSTSPSSMVMGMPDAFVVWLPGVTIIVGLLATASLLQADSPTRANAFWASRPLSPSAVLVAKLAVVATTVIALPLLGGFTALASLDTNAGATTILLMRAALSYGEWAIAVIVIGALTDDIRAFVGAFVGVLIAIVVVYGVLPDFNFETTTFVLDILALAGIGGGILLVAFLYRTRDRRPCAWVAGIAASVCLVTASFVPPPLQGADVPDATAVAAVEIASIDPSSLAQSRQLSIKLRVAQQSDSERLDFQPDSVVFQTLDGKSVHVDGSYYPSLPVRQALPPIERSVRWLVDQPSVNASTGFSVEPRDVDRQVMLAGVRSVMVAGTATVSRSHVVASLPLRNDAAVTRDGRRVAIYGSSHDAIGADVWVQMSAVPRVAAVPEPDAQLREKNGIQFVIVNDSRGEAMLIDKQSASSGGSGSIVLPWISISTTFSRLSTSPLSSSTNALPRDDGWYAGARLVVVEWNVVGRYRTRAESMLPQRSASVPSSGLRFDQFPELLLTNHLHRVSLSGQAADLH